MPTGTEIRRGFFDGWTFRLQPARRGSGRLLVLLHGWTGDEESMWVLARNLPDRYVIFAPRAPYAAPEGGYTWRHIQPGSWGLSSIAELRPAAEALIGLIDGWSAAAGVDAGRMDLMGFSQGAALSYALVSLFPERIGSVAALSGFLPEGVEAVLVPGTLEGKPIFIAHGRQDDMVPLERAQASAALLKSAGAKVTYCESVGGHKVSRECLTAMEGFFHST